MYRSCPPTLFSRHHSFFYTLLELLLLLVPWPSLAILHPTLSSERVVHGRHVPPPTTSTAPSTTSTAQKSLRGQHPKLSTASLLPAAVPSIMPLVPEVALSASSACVIRELAFGKSVELEDSSDAVAPSIPSGSEDVDVWARFIRTSDTIYGDASKTDAIRSMTTNSKPYSNEKLVTTLRFFKILATTAEFKSLTEIATSDEGTKTWLFFKMLQGTKTASKKLLLNAALVAFGTRIRKKDYADGADISHLPKLQHAEILYQPNVLQKIFKHLSRSSRTTASSSRNRTSRRLPGLTRPSLL